MIIEEVTVKNFRSIKDCSIKCNPLTVFLGRNGAGKTSFLYALNAFYDVSADITIEDFHGRDAKAKIEIAVTYSNLRDDEKKEFENYIKNDKLSVIKKFEMIDGIVDQRYYANKLQVPQFAEIRKMESKKDRTADFNKLVDGGTFSGLERARSADDAETKMLEYEKMHPELLKSIESQIEFIATKNVGDGKLDKYTKFILVPAVREASQQVTGKKGAIEQILDTIVLKQIESREDLKKFREKFDKEYKEAYSSQNLAALPEIGDTISQMLDVFAPGSKLNLNWSEAEPLKFPLPAAQATLIEDSFEGDISRKGHGLQRALILTLLQYMSTLEQPIEGGGLGQKQATGPNLIIAIEEPELYMHPLRCRYLSKVFLKLTNATSDCASMTNQIFYSTHSPYFVDLDRYNQIRVIRKIAQHKDSVPESRVSNVQINLLNKELARIWEKDPQEFTPSSFKAHAAPVMNTVINEGFFADTIVVVEGLSEVGALWKLQEIMKKEWYEKGIAVVPAGGKANIDRPTIIFKGFGIPTYFIFDADASKKADDNANENKKAISKKTAEQNRAYLRLANAALEDFPKTHINENWAVFENNLEDEIKNAIGNETFNEICRNVAVELGYADKDDVCKNIECIGMVIESIYAQKKKVESLEKVVDSITEFANKSKSAK